MKIVDSEELRKFAKHYKYLLIYISAIVTASLILELLR